ncbi:nitrogenase cofactor biosynthesis protein NifB [Rhodoferax sp. 4810]|uniref:Nitrogenase cofactor biosynthesis protein NifB n=1 Tax=Thiospirillum jenense TaxID=1653858 RepID=A0A839H4D4_9GAMM|nr:nitrogenase cofactor biosynthesis protein NifB [Thiospirillum jenense]MBB1073057.1 nitrogenase cofactor biosynthesis protein NifB [Rhodoferax jenense]MBB1125005.1 nitrogenase cofactor biosynthesis protein NifB [Thiospirillum jenense]
MNITHLKPVAIDNAPDAAGGCKANQCGSSTAHLAQLPANIRAKVNNHPCFSEDAHHHYARMHVAVAPGCNIQCNYCNRKYDCTNESRPGVVSELLTPEQAIQKVLVVATAIPQLSVVGIAGPGDPLANPRRTFATLDALSQQAPDLKLCISTNGLMLPSLIDRLCAYNIEHVTITINCLDPEIGAQIYPWIFWNHRRIKGRDAAHILIEQQQLGLDMLVARGVLVKVNSVMIPGINDEHLREVSRVVKEKGAFLHNVMPLIAAPEHGTVYGLNGQRSPTADELTALQTACAGNMRMMRHCRQCRADAVGLLGEDRNAEFDLAAIATQSVDYVAAMRQRAEVHANIEKHRAALQQSSVAQVPLTALRNSAPTSAITSPALLMAVATQGGELVNASFNQAREFLIYTVTATHSQLIGVRKSPAQLNTNNDEWQQSSNSLSASGQMTVNTLAGCDAVLCATIGYQAWEQLENARITPNSEYAQQPISTALTAVYCELIAQRPTQQSTQSSKHSIPDLLRTA